MIKPLNDCIFFQSHEIDFTLSNIPEVTSWLSEIARELKRPIHSLQYTFCNDGVIKDINTSFLQHDHATDIITFPYQYNPIEADIYISTDTVKKNAIHFDESFERELLRVIVHGLLHMLGWDDKTAEAKKEMREAENKYLEQYFNSHKQ